MSWKRKLVEELNGVLAATLFFGLFIAALMTLKKLVLEEYHIGFSGWSKAVVGALVLGKVSLVLEHVSFGDWIRRRPAMVDLVLRTLLYAVGVAVVMLLERGIETRHEHGGVFEAMRVEIQDAKFPHVMVNTICLSLALLMFNLLAVVRRHLGPKGLPGLLADPLPPKPDVASKKTESSPPNDEGQRLK